MKILRVSDCLEFPADLRGCVVAIGNFDGVHRGHQSVLERALALAQAEARPAVVLTFEPHPQEVFRPDMAHYRLTPAPMKARILGLLGFNAVVEQRFTAAFSALSADEFVDQILVHGLGARHVVTGFDFCYGKGRKGTTGSLVEAGSRLGFDVSAVSQFSDEGGLPISSSRIRQLLESGAVAEAAGLLGYRYTVEAEISKGKQLGRTLGFPTANMRLPACVALKHGIYAVKFRREDGTIHDGVASFGRRPTVDSDGEPLLETFVFDFSDDLYGEMCRVSFFGFLRGEVRFDGLDPLVAQMNRDTEEARALLSGIAPLSPVDRMLAFDAE